MTNEIHPSSVARILKCGMSKNTPDTIIDSSSKPARMGSAMHEVLAHMISNNLEARPDLKPYLKKYDLADEDQLGYLTWAGFEAWKEIRDDIKVLGIEAQGIVHIQDDWAVTGTTDLYGETLTDELVVLDWKSSQAESDTESQLTAYAFLISKTLKKNYETIKLITVWARLQTITIVDITAAELEKFEDDLMESIVSDQYSPGDHCLYCSHQYECEAKSKMLISVSNDLQIKSDNSIASIIDLAKQYPKVKILEQAIKDFKDIVKDHLKNNDPVLLDDGQYLGLSTRKTEKLVSDKAYEMICEEIGIEVSESFNTFKDAISLNKSKALKIISDQAPRGEKKEAKAAFIEKLKEEKAMTVSETFLFNISGG
ncbi:MAG: hypothetical protein DRQ46_00040 [Gammaproteobacteria bacterium]|nr:MAG: hypothetical protein DRQ46_00040 [Gammaproteobacteria bacterium]